MTQEGLSRLKLVAKVKAKLLQNGSDKLEEKYYAYYAFSINY